MNTHAIVLEQPGCITLQELELAPPGEGDITVDVDWSGISTGTERLLWSGKMPSFPGMGYPLVPGYESVGRVTAINSKASKFSLGETVFVPGANCYGDIKGLFGGSASTVVVPESRVISIPENLQQDGVLMALAATAYHVTGGRSELQPDLIVGHGVLGRLLARLSLLFGEQAPVVWETNDKRREGAEGYTVMHPDDDSRHDYARIIDVSGDASLLDGLISRLAKGGEITLAGFYSDPIQFLFPLAFMKEARLRIAAEWQPQDLASVCQLIENGQLSLNNLITHQSHVVDASDAYNFAFTNSTCLKMILDWRET